MSPVEAELVRLMDDAVEFSIRHVESGGIPFVGVLLDQWGYVSPPGVNEVARTGDTTAHAEIVAMRAAMSDLGLADLRGTWLLATGEPCGLCYRFALDHHVERVYVAVDAETVARHGFDYRGSYPAFGIDRSRLTGVVVHALPVERRLEPFTRFLTLQRDGAHTPALPSTVRKGPS